MGHAARPPGGVAPPPRRRGAPTAAGRTGLLGIIGRPVLGSLSPRMHNAALAHLGIEALYLPFEIREASVRDVLRALPALGFWGLNVTIPYKELVPRWLDELDEEAAALGAVNTIVVRGGRLSGHNTDGRGFLTALRAEGGVDLRGEAVLLVGAGGAARAIAFACARGGAARLVIANRDRDRAESLRRSLRRAAPGTEVLAVGTGEEAFASLAGESQILVNATPLGSRRGDPLPVPAGRIRSSQCVVDIVYRPLRTPLLAAAEAAGARCLNGLGMLLYQGALAFRLWTGREAPLEVMRRALLSAPGVRS